MKTLTVAFLILANAFLAYARLPAVRWTSQELYDRADLVVIAKYISTTNTTEESVLPSISPDVHVIGLSSKFDITIVMKGDANLKRITLHHYKLAPLPPNTIMVNGPNLASFDSAKDYTRYLLFLNLEADGRYAPVFSQTSPDNNAIFKLDGNVR
jgi:hypothetical protein